MRREIARQMHDGPAQSIANIALQAEVVQRLLRQDASAGERELNALRDMVEHALEETKAFIFDVRPMVLDDLGLMPTLRRAAQDRARRTGRRIRFESLGADRRLDPEHESALFRIVDDAVTGYLEAQPDDVLVRLTWSEDDVTATSSVSRCPPASRPLPSPNRSTSSRRAALPPALAAMIDEQRDLEHLRAAVSLPAAIMKGIRSRAAAAGIEIEVSGDGRAISATSTSASPPTCRFRAADEAHHPDYANGVLRPVPKTHISGAGGLVISPHLVNQARTHRRTACRSFGDFWIAMSVGQGLAEYALILALIAIVAIAALVFLGGQISAILSSIGQAL